MLYILSYTYTYTVYHDVRLASTSTIRAKSHENFRHNLGVTHRSSAHTRHTATGTDRQIPDTRDHCHDSQGIATSILTPILVID
eukprot:scaffold14870_cov119-Isochrysis_galbana.AAC.3